VDVMRGRRAVVMLGVLAVAVLAAAVAGAKVLPVPGTPSVIAAEVASSHTIEKLPGDLVPPLADLGSDNAAAWGYWKITHGCTTTTECVYGDRTSTQTVAMLGDSHAAMWLPAIDWVGRHLGFRVVLLWRPACPAADVSVWDPSLHAIDAGCNAFRKASIAAIEKLAPTLVLTANRTANVLGEGSRFIPSATWRAGLERTLATFLADKLKVAVIGDVTPLTNPIPACLAVHPTGVQDCSSPNPNPAKNTQRKAEEAAAKDEGVPYVNPEPWLCTNVCSPIVGKYAAYYDWQHVSATYSAYLALEWEAVLKALLATG
jgi:hypothetical protein